MKEQDTTETPLEQLEQTLRCLRNLCQEFERKVDSYRVLMGGTIMHSESRFLYRRLAIEPDGRSKGAYEITLTCVLKDKVVFQKSRKIDETGMSKEHALYMRLRAEEELLTEWIVKCCFSSVLTNQVIKNFVTDLSQKLKVIEKAPEYT